MVNKRIPDMSLPDKFKDGDYLTEIELNQLVSVFKAGINYNKEDLDKIITSNENKNIFYDYLNLIELEGNEGDYSYLIEDNIKLYKHTEGMWEYETNISLIDLYERINECSLTGSPLISYEDEPEDVDFYIKIEV